MLKLQELKNEVSRRVEILANRTDLEAYAKQLKESGNYKNFSVRLVNDIKYATFRSSEVCSWYEKYNCNDDHVTSLFLSVVKEYCKRHSLNLGI